MPKITILVGPPGSGKSTTAKNYHCSFEYINQDTQDKEHLNIFQKAIKNKSNIIVDRMNFDKKQRARYLNPAKERGYETEIIVLHQSLDTCLKRCNARDDHPTIRTEQDARKALDFFFKSYERPTLEEADNVKYIYPEQELNLTTCIFDLDGTLCDIDHRLNHMQGKKNWQQFFAGIKDDKLNLWCRALINNSRKDYIITLCSGRPDDHKKVTKEWLENNKIFYDYLFMRQRNDSRKDYITKEVILDFEILTRFSNILFIVDDRPSVCRMWRSRGFTVLQCNDKEF